MQHAAAQPAQGLRSAGCSANPCLYSLLQHALTCLNCSKGGLEGIPFILTIIPCCLQVLTSGKQR
jgi:hypothetical protein